MHRWLGYLPAPQAGCPLLLLLAWMCVAAADGGAAPSAADGGQCDQRCKSIAFVRHAQGTHNLAEERTSLNPPDQVLLYASSGRKYWDAPLTEKGKAQCASLREQLTVNGSYSPPAAVGPEAVPLELIVTSSLRRAIQTAIHTFGRPPCTSNPGSLDPWSVPNASVV